MSLKRILMTGSSGFYGRALVAAIRKHWPEAEILGLDVSSPQSDPPDHFQQCDITSPQLGEQVIQFRPDTILHLAFVVNPIHDARRMHQINVEATRNLLTAASVVEPERVFVVSSATVYGAWPDNPVPISESHPIRPRTDHLYANDKHEVELLLREFQKQHPAIAVNWSRPCMIMRSDMSNYMTDFITKGKGFLVPGGSNPPTQYVHLDDVAEASIAIIRSHLSGPFNIAPPDYITTKEIAEMSGRPVISLPYAICYGLTWLLWNLRLPGQRFPPSMWNFARYPWVVSPERLLTETGFRFQYSSREVVEMLLKDAGLLKEEPQTQA